MSCAFLRALTFVVAFCEDLNSRLGSMQILLTKKQENKKKTKQYVASPGVLMRSNVFKLELYASCQPASKLSGEVWRLGEKRRASNYVSVI